MQFKTVPTNPFSGSASQRFNRESLLAELNMRLNVQELLKNIDAQPGLLGAGVVYFNGFDVLIVREFEPLCRIDPVNVIIRAAPKGTVSEAQPSNQNLERQNPQLYSTVNEITGTVLACGAAVLGWVVVLGSGAAAAPTLGSSTAVTVLATSAAIASSVQCASGVIRVGFAATGREEELAWLDSQQWYQKTMVALDIVSLAGVGAAAVVTLKTLKVVKSSGSTVSSALKGMPRQERKRLTEELIRQLRPGISNSAIKAYIRAGVYPARHTQAQISHQMRGQLLDAVGATMSFSGSAISGVIRHPDQIQDLVFGISFPVKTI